MKIAFLSQMGFTGKIPREHRNMRTEFAQMCALKADHYCIHAAKEIGDVRIYDHAVVLVPKSTPDRDKLLFQPDLAETCRNFAKNVWFMQEGPNWIFQDMSVLHQFWHSNFLQSVDGILTENVTDIPYYKGFVDRDIPIESIPTLMIEDMISGNTTTSRRAVILGGNFVRWYGGFDSFMVATEFLPEHEIDSVSMGRMAELEGNIEAINHLPYMDWLDWINNLKQYRVGIHLMPTIAAGTFALNCAYWGIPCIGYEDLDTQRLCHPSLSFKMGDLASARRAAERLKLDEQFYDKCSEEAKANYKVHFSENVFLDKMEQIFNKLNHKEQ